MFLFLIIAIVHNSSCYEGLGRIIKVKGVQKSLWVATKKKELFRSVFKHSYKEVRLIVTLHFMIKIWDLMVRIQAYTSKSVRGLHLCRVELIFTTGVIYSSGWGDYVPGRRQTYLQHHSGQTWLLCLSLNGALGSGQSVCRWWLQLRPLRAIIAYGHPQVLGFKLYLGAGRFVLWRDSG